MDTHTNRAKRMSLFGTPRLVRTNIPGHIVSFNDHVRHGYVVFEGGKVALVEAHSSDLSTRLAGTDNGLLFDLYETSDGLEVRNACVLSAEDEHRRILNTLLDGVTGMMNVAEYRIIRTRSQVNANDDIDVPGTALSNQSSSERDPSQTEGISRSVPHVEFNSTHSVQSPDEDDQHPALEDKALRVQEIKGTALTPEDEAEGEQATKPISRDTAQASATQTPLTGSMRQMLISALQERGESNNLDFKLTINLAETKDKVELARDVIAFANTRGGLIVFGVKDRTFEPVGLPTTCPNLDTSDVYKAIERYVKHTGIEITAHTYSLTAADVPAAEWPDTRRFGVLRIEPHPELAMPSSNGVYQENGKDVYRFREKDHLIRRGAQTTEADIGEVRRLLQDRPQVHAAVEPQEASVLMSNLPAREEVAYDFIGRAEQLMEIETWFNDSRQRRWMLVGDGGKGKTAIAYEFASRIQDAAPRGYHCIIWLSAKRRRYLERGVVDIGSPDFWDLSSLLDGIARGYGFAEYTQLSLPDKEDSVVELLAKLPALIIADDIDSLDTQDEDAVAFLMDTSRIQSKVLLTSRRLPYGFGASFTEVKGLNAEDSLLFIDSRIRLLKLDNAIFTTKVRRRIIEVTDGSPLYIEDLLRLSAVCPPIDRAIREWEDTGGHIARRYALEREYDQLDRDAKRILLTCCIPDGPVSLTEIKVITDLPEERIVASIPDLQRLFLVSRPKLIETEERFVLPHGRM